MAMTISGSNGVTYPDGTSQASGSQACKAWVNFNGTGTVAIRASYNVSSITDNGTGDYTVNFTTALADANYAVTGTSRSSGVTSGFAIQPETYSAGSIRILTLNSGLSYYDPTQVNIVINR